MSHEEVSRDTGIVRELVQETGTFGYQVRYRIEITSEGACRSCALVKHCYGSGSVVAATPVRLTVGQSVRLEMTSGNTVKATGWIYGVSLARLIAAILGSYLWLFSGQGENLRVRFSILVGVVVVIGWFLSRVNHTLAARLSIRAVPA